MTETTITNAHPWRRLMAIVYEAVILFGVLWLANYLFSTLTTFRGEPGALRVGSQIFLALVMAVYFGWQWAGGRRTLAMKTLDLQLVDEQGRYLSSGRAVLRYLVVLAMTLLALAVTRWHASGAVLLLLPASWSLIDGQRRALYDRLAGTRLVMQSAVPRSKATPGRS